MKLRADALQCGLQMKKLAFAALVLFAVAAFAEEPSPAFDEKAAERFANLALACVGKENPNKISHLLNSDADVAPPRKLTPAFYGCYDWHSSVTDTGFSRAWPALFLTRLSPFSRAHRCSRA